jgi:hypothetical protein
MKELADFGIVLFESLLESFLACRPFDVLDLLDVGPLWRDGFCGFLDRCFDCSKSSTSTERQRRDGGGNDFPPLAGRYLDSPGVLLSGNDGRSNNNVCMIDWNASRDDRIGQISRRHVDAALADYSVVLRHCLPLL